MAISGAKRVKLYRWDSANTDWIKWDGEMTLIGADIQIGAVELKDHDGTDRLEITSSNAAKVDGSAVTQPVSGTFWPTTQPVSGTITADAGTNLNTSSLLTSTAFTTRIGDVGASPAANTILGRLKDISDGQLADSHNVTVDNTAGSGVYVRPGTSASFAVTGTFWQDTQPISGSVTADTELTTGDLDIGAGTDTRAVIGLVGSKSGGGELIPGSATSGLLVNLGTNNDITMATLPDTAAGDLAAINSAVSGTLTVSGTVSSNATLQAGTAKIGDTGLLGNTAADGSGTDYHALIDTAGHFQIDVVSAPTTAVTGTFWQTTQPVSLASVPSHEVTNAGTFAVQISDTSFAVADGNALGEGVLIQGDDGTDRKNINVDATTGDVQVDVTNTVTVDLGANNDVTNTVLAVTGGGAEATAQRVTIANDSTGLLSVDDNASSLTVDTTGTSGLEVVQDTAADLKATVTQASAARTITSGSIDVLGDTAHDAADSGDPVKIGGRAQEPTAALEEVTTDNDRVDAAFDRQGRIATWMGYPVKSADINDSTSGDNTIQAAAGAGLRIAVLGCVIVSDGTVDVRWEDGAGGTAKTGQIPLQAREGFVMPIGNQPWFVGTANTLLNLELTAAINVHGIVSYVEMTD